MTEEETGRCKPPAFCWQLLPVAWCRRVPKTPLPVQCGEVTGELTLLVQFTPCSSRWS